MKVGVIVGRFQVGSLTEGHEFLIQEVLNQNDRVIIFVGTSIVKSSKNPLKFDMIKESILSKFFWKKTKEWHNKPPTNNIDIIELPDNKSNKVWVETLDALLYILLKDSETTLYGSRNSFLDTYKKYGNNKFIELTSPIPEISATEIRTNIKYENNVSFRNGYIKSVQDEFLAHFSVVDAIITDGENVLLGKKDSGWCLIGGFADDEDGSLEDAIKREVREETQLIVDNAEYLMSHQCNDWRYRNARQPFSSVFICKHFSLSEAIPGDDINQVKVVKLTKIENYLKKEDSHLIYIKKYLEKC